MARLIIALCCVVQMSATSTTKQPVAFSEKKQLQHLLIENIKTLPVCKSSKNLIIQTLNPSLRVNL